MIEQPPLKAMRIGALISVCVGALGSLALTLYAGRHNKSIILIMLFGAWVLSPFITLQIANIVSNRWTRNFRKSLYILMVVLSATSIICYFSALSHGRNKPAAIFLLVPFGSLVVIALFVWLAEYIARKRGRGLTNTNNLEADAH